MYDTNLACTPLNDEKESPLFASSSSSLETFSLSHMFANWKSLIKRKDLLTFHSESRKLKMVIEYFVISLRYRMEFVKYW